MSAFKVDILFFLKERDEEAMRLLEERKQFPLLASLFQTVSNVAGTIPELKIGTLPPEKEGEEKVVTVTFILPPETLNRIEALTYLLRLSPKRKLKPIISLRSS